MEQMKEWIGCILITHLLTKSQKRIVDLSLLLSKRSQKYIAFLTAYELYQFKIMPFRLVNTPATFQRLINDILRDYLRKFCLIYLDNIIIYFKSLKDHKRHVRKVLQAIRSAGLKLKPAKCK